MFVVCYWLDYKVIISVKKSRLYSVIRWVSDGYKWKKTLSSPANELQTNNMTASAYHKTCIHLQLVKLLNFFFFVIFFYVLLLILSACLLGFNMSAISDEHSEIYLIFEDSCWLTFTRSKAQVSNTHTQQFSSTNTAIWFLQLPNSFSKRYQHHTFAVIGTFSPLNWMLKYLF